MTHKVFITGAAGYVGAMLSDQFSKRSDVEKIIALDKDGCPGFLKDNKKIVWIQANTSAEGWQDRVREYEPDIVVHTAWQIREMYGRKDIEWKWNVEGSDAVFEFALQTQSVKRFVHFSTAAVYGAYETNTLDHLFKEDEKMREEEYSYGLEKRKVEEMLEARARSARAGGNRMPQISIVRPAAITGPRGRFMRVRFGLQSALSGQLKGDFLYRIISALVSFVPATPWWVRQFVHEDDVTDIVARLAFGEPCKKDNKKDVENAYEIYNLAPSGEPVLAPQMAEAVGKKTLSVYPWMVRFAYFVFWHLTRGKVPTGRGVWRFYSYPIVMDGSKITRECGYEYKYDSLSAFSYTAGRYEQFVPEESRKSARY